MPSTPAKTGAIRPVPSNHETERNQAAAVTLFGVPILVQFSNPLKKTLLKFKHY